MLKPYPFNGLVAGCDEAGRGCLAGPVVAAAVILPKKFKSHILNDSKKLTEKKRGELEGLIKNSCISWGIGIVSAKEIDEINILNASFLAMHRAIGKLAKNPKLLIIDGNRFNKYKNTPHQCIVKGDGKYLSIAAASILAKTNRDEYMKKMDNEHPDYRWKKNKGYPTKEHRIAIQEKGITQLHRKSFKQLPTQLKLNI